MRSRFEGRLWAFKLGVVAIGIGVILHVPDFLMMADMHFVMTGMSMSPVMGIGMMFIMAGLGLAVWGVLPRGKQTISAHSVALQVSTLDDAPLSPAHRKLAVVLGLAIIIDTMKPATLGFVLPGLSDEYGIDTKIAATLPFVALTGTVIGSIAWSMLSDRIGRRATILLSGLLFMSTSICGFMPDFGWNLVMCFLMGASAGGMLPIAYALMAESMPAKQRGWLIVLQTGLGSVGGYLVASAAAAALEPVFGWRILWVLGLPSGLALLLLNRWIPESPRYLLATGRYEEARQVMAGYGVTARAIGPNPGSAVDHQRVATIRTRVLRLFQPPYTLHTVTVLGYALAWGLVNWGFITFLPTFLRAASGQTNVLFTAALIAVPNTFIVAYLYIRWSSKHSMVVYAGLAAIALLGFAVTPESGLRHEALMLALIAALLMSTGGMIAMLAPYSTELYPTALRASGSGLTAAASKAGGMIGPPLIGLLAASAPLQVIALLTAAPVVGVATTLGITGRETARQPLTEESAQVY